MKKELLIVGITALLIAVGLSGCIEENILPIAGFTTSVVNTGSLYIRGVQFSDNSSDPDGEIVAWHWDFGDGGTSNEQNPKHNYSGISSVARASGGYYVTLGEINGEPIVDGPFFNVTLTVTDDKNSSTSVTKTVYADMYPISIVHRELIVNFTYTPTENITNQTIIEFNASSSIVAMVDQEGSITSLLDKNMTYYWDFGDGTNITDLNATTNYQYAAAGLYTVNLTVVDEEDYSDYITKEIIVS